MDLFGRAVRNARNSVTTRGAEFGDSSLPPNSSFGGSVGGFLNESAALGVSTVLNCVKVLHNDMGILPFAAYTGDRHGVKQRLASQPQIVAEPFGPDLSLQAGIGQIVASITLRGNAFTFVTQSDSQGNPLQLQILHPDRVSVYRDSATRAKLFKINNEYYGGDKVKHFTGLMLPGDLAGVDPVTYQRINWGLAADVNEYGANFFRNGTSPSGVIEAPGELDRKGARALKDGWEVGNSGLANAHRVAVLSGGASWKQMSVTPENAQFLGTRSLLREEICGWFGVPLQRIMAIVAHASQGGGKGLDAIDQGYATHTLLPFAWQLETVWNAMVPGGQSTWTQFDFSGLLRASALERAQIAQAHRLVGIRNRDEIRADEGWPAIGGPDGTDYNIPFNTNSAVPPPIDPATGMQADPTATDGSTI